jgi:hypothetical protein
MSLFDAHCPFPDAALQAHPLCIRTRIVRDPGLENCIESSRTNSQITPRHPMKSHRIVRMSPFSHCCVTEYFFYRKRHKMNSAFFRQSLSPLPPKPGHRLGTKYHRHSCLCPYLKNRRSQPRMPVLHRRLPHRKDLSDRMGHDPSCGSNDGVSIIARSGRLYRRTRFGRRVRTDC